MKKHWILKDAQTIFFALGAVFFICAINSILFNSLELARFKIGSTQVASTRLIIYACAVAPLLEEFLFRYMPVRFMKKLVTAKKFEETKWELAIVSAIFFGCLLHYGYWSIWIQGVLGFFCSYVYYKTRFSYVSAVITHGLWNCSLYVILPLVLN